MFCSNCGSQIDEGARFCASCGSVVDAAPAEGTVQNPQVQTVQAPPYQNLPPPEQSGGDSLRVFGIVLVVAGGIAGFATYFADMLPVSVFAIIGVVAGVVIIQKTKKLPLEPGEIVLYEGSAALGEGSAVTSRSKADCKVVITSVGIKAGSVYHQEDLLTIPFQTMAKVEKESALSARVYMGDGQSVKFQFGIGKIDRFLGILAHNKVPVTAKQ
jgi:hypothetical protein